MWNLKFKPAETRSTSTEGAEAAVQAYVDLAEGVYRLGRIDEAADLMARAAEAAHELGDDDPRACRVVNRFAVIRARQGRHAEAERLLKRTVTVFDRAGLAGDSQLPTVLSNLGAVYRMAGKTEQARETFERALRLAEVADKESIEVAWTLDQIGDLNAGEDDIPAAVFAFQRALAIKEKVLGENDWDVAVTLNKLGELYLKQGRYNEAEAFLLRVLEIRERVLGWGDPHLAKPLAKLGLLYRRQRKDGRAEHIVRYALKLFSSVLPPDHPDVIGCLKLLSEIYRGLTRYSDADAAWSLAQNLSEGKGHSEKLAALTLPNPPRLSSAGLPAYQSAAR